MTSPDEIVRAMFDRWSDPDRDPDRIGAYFAADAVYHNRPMPPIVGRPAIRDFIGRFLFGFESIRIDIHHQITSGGLVMNERTDILRGPAREIELPVMGVFEIDGAVITAWRDYYDMGTLVGAVGSEPESAPVARGSGLRRKFWR
ncbi:limonene-1,2-epoxide hydrolase family protein [Nocardia mexicana]|uniref:Limonene-1,2-epoxide hydrolase n=1 Tax=Nocardia mexicana TaxID=279262 RepID=A0A370GHR6_9NOCA|nr:limonene-1,2-epoxide hydrolase family protein [Nocardia mexicana]RDI42786.1 limonene-1,2-epoxide hydrolase [Nocardia mexicana]